MTSLVRVKPDGKYIAEVLVLLTTLRAKRSEFNSGRSIQDFLQIKRAHYKAVDFNRDARVAGAGDAENLAVQKLLKMGKLRMTEEDDLILPQIFIDGQYVGGMEDIQALENDDRLELILKRQEKDWKIEEILPGLMTMDEAMANHDANDRLGGGKGGDSDDDDYEYGSDSDSD